MYLYAALDSSPERSPADTTTQLRSAGETTIGTVHERIVGEFSTTLQGPDPALLMAASPQHAQGISDNFSTNAIKPVYHALVVRRGILLEQRGLNTQISRKRTTKREVEEAAWNGRTCKRFARSNLHSSEYLDIEMRGIVGNTLLDQMTHLRTALDRIAYTCRQIPLIEVIKGIEVARFDEDLRVRIESE